MSDVEFVDELPPFAFPTATPHTTRYKHYAPIVDACIANPGKWAVLRRGPLANRHSIATTAYKIADRYDLAYATRRVGDEVIAYVSYEGKRKELQ